MQNPTGTFIVLEGADGSGKGTQFRLLTERLKAVGYDVAVFDFPQYDQESSYFVRKYLNGGYGKANTISPYTSSLFYALDRYEASFKIRKALNEGKIILCNRFVGSNMAHQGSKITDSMEQRSFFVWEDSLEFQLLNIPRPKLNIFLRVPADISYELIKQKAARNYTDKTHDEHEGDIEHLKNSIKTYDQLCELFPNDFQAIECVNEGKLLSIPDINNMIWQMIQPVLPPKPDGPGRSVTLDLSKQEANKEYSKSDSSAQINEVIIERKISLLLASEIYPWLDESHGVNLTWSANNYEYFTPAGLNQKTKNQYTDLMSKIVSKRKDFDQKVKNLKLAKNLAFPTTPLSALVKVKIVANENNVNALLDALLSHNIPECTFLAKDIDAQAKKIFQKQYTSPSLLNNDDPNSKLLDKIIKKLSSADSQNYSSDSNLVDLVSYSPRNEFKILSEILYSYGNLTRSEIDDEFSKLPYQQKADATISALETNGFDIRSSIRYCFNINHSRESLFSLEKIKNHHSIKIQPPTPRYGYSVPRLIDDEKLTDDYLYFFDLSLELYSYLQADDKTGGASYGVLLGHKNQMELNCDLNFILEAQKLLSHGQGKELFDAIHDKVAEVHPLIATMLSKKNTTQINPAKKTRR